MTNSVLETQTDGSHHSKSLCSPCHYSCKTCSGGSELECLSCRDDSKLHATDSSNYVTESRCYSMPLLNSIESNQYWYKSVIMIVVVNVLVVVPLVLCLYYKHYGVRIGVNSTWLQRRAYSRVSNEDDCARDTITDVRYSIPPPPSQTVPSSTLQ